MMARDPFAVTTYDRRPGLLSLARDITVNSNIPCLWKGISLVFGPGPVHDAGPTYDYERIVFTESS
jgi:hypothetical protein